MRVLFSILLIILFSIQGHAAMLPEEILEEQERMLGTSTLLQALPSELSSQEQDLLNPDFPGQASRILHKAIADNQAGMHSAFACGAALLAVSLLCACLGSLEDGLSQTVLRIAGVVSITLICVVPMNTLIGAGAGALDEVSLFMDVLLPALAAAVTASGAPVSSSGLYLGTAFFASLLTNLISQVFLPLLYVDLACACTEQALGNQMLTRMRSLIHSGLSFCLKALLVLFSLYLSITSLISGSADNAAVKAAKLAISGIVPVIGSVIGDASETILVSASILRSGIGALGLLGVLAIVLTPFVRIGIQYLVLKLFAALSGILGAEGPTRMIDAAASAMGLLLAMIGTVGLFHLIACVCFMKAVIPA